MEADDILQHYGIPGMKWHRRRQQRKAEKAEADFQRRSKVINRIKKQGEDAETDLGTIYVLRGEKAANRVLDLMDKNPKRSLKSASRQQFGEEVAKQLLISFGAIAVGRGLASFTIANGY